MHGFTLHSSAHATTMQLPCSMEVYVVRGCRTRKPFEPCVTCPLTADHQITVAKLDAVCGLQVLACSSLHLHGIPATTMSLRKCDIGSAHEHFSRHSGRYSSEGRFVFCVVMLGFLIANVVLEAQVTCMPCNILPGLSGPMRSVTETLSTHPCGRHAWLHASTAACCKAARANLLCCLLYPHDQHSSMSKNILTLTKKKPSLTKEHVHP